MLIQGNEIISNGNYGIHVDNTSANSSYSNNQVDIAQNTISDHASHGINFGYSYGDIIQNLIVNNGAHGIYINNAYYGDFEVRNNTIDGNADDGIYWQSNSSSSYTLDARNNSITNNGEHGINCYNGGNSNTIAYNNIYGNSSDPLNNFSGSMPSGVGEIEEWCVDIMCDIASNLTTDPLYEADYTLQIGSPNIDHGDPSVFDSDNTVSDIGALPLLQEITIIGVSQASVDFGEVTVGTDSTYSITITALGTLDDLEVTDIFVDGDGFSVSPAYLFITIGQSQDIEITFTPSSNIEYSGSLTLINNSENDGEYVVSLTGTGYIPPNISVNPQQINMSLLEGQGGITRSMTIGNSGSDDLEWNLGISGNILEANEWTFTG